MMEKLLYPTHSVRCIVTGPSCYGKSVFLTSLFLNTLNENDKLCIYSRSLHQDLYQRIIKCFSNCIPIHIILNVPNAEGIDIVIEEIVKNKDFEKSYIEIETYESIEESESPKENEDGGFMILDDLNEKEMNDPRVQARFKRRRHNNLSTFNISQGYYELLKRNMGADGNIYHNFKPNNFRDLLNIYQDKSSIDTTLKEFKLLTSIFWNEKYQQLSFDMTQDKHTG